jgi:hypothetical protein
VPGADGLNLLHIGVDNGQSVGCFLAWRPGSPSHIPIIIELGFSQNYEQPWSIVNV